MIINATAFLLKDSASTIKYSFSRSSIIMDLEDYTRLQLSKALNGCYDV